MSFVVHGKPESVVGAVSESNPGPNTSIVDPEKKLVQSNKSDANIDERLVSFLSLPLLIGSHVEIQVTWESDDDPNIPYNWPSRRKLSMAYLISLGGLVMTMSASIMAPSLSEIASDLKLDPESAQISFSIYTLALAFGPLLIGPLSEIYGRKLVWIICNGWYTLFNSLCPINKSSAIMISGRFLAGLGASVGIAVCLIASPLQ